MALNSYFIIYPPKKILFFLFFQHDPTVRVGARKRLKCVDEVRLKKSCGKNSPPEGVLWTATSTFMYAGS